MEYPDCPELLNTVLLACTDLTARRDIDAHGSALQDFTVDAVREREVVAGGVA